MPAKTPPQLTLKMQMRSWQIKMTYASPQKGVETYAASACRIKNDKGDPRRRVDGRVDRTNDLMNRSFSQPLLVAARIWQASAQHASTEVIRSERGRKT
ncbi:hypothetical protein SE91_02230 [Bradyrhizobium sp. DOA1]|nr:hypothetical protein SE91_02230 [Bradyrhizobium sp. DOA1]